MSVWPCPVCQTPTVVDYNDCSEGVQLEYADHCPNGCMESRFAYGFTEERIGQRWWQWGYTETPEEAKKRQQERLEAIKELKDAKQRTVPERP